jgi:hypothetical protein
MSIERDEQIRFHELGTLNSVISHPPAYTFLGQQWRMS